MDYFEDIVGGEQAAAFLVSDVNLEVVMLTFAQFYILTGSHRRTALMFYGCLISAHNDIASDPEVARSLM